MLAGWRRLLDVVAGRGGVEALTFHDEHDHKGNYEGQTAVLLHQNGKPDYVAESDGVAVDVLALAELSWGTNIGGEEEEEEEDEEDGSQRGC